LLLDFLTQAKAETLYLVGDIVDLEALRRGFYWPKAHTLVLERLLEMSRDGTRIYFVPGNHDDDFRVLHGTRIGGIEVRRQMIHTTANGKRLLVLHGDEFDSALKCGALAIVAGALGYHLLLTLNRLNHGINDLLGKPYWSLAQYVKMKIGKAVRYVERYQDACLKAAQEAGVDGVVCGHIHKADIIERRGLLYCNDGDWVESCTALVESESGELSLCVWAGERRPVHVREAIPLKDAA
jgi:UDP-2,3-diacylglucosamine pyrophosphatase LpxH